MSTPKENDRPAPSGRNRRLSRRLPAQRGIKAVCRRGSLDLGKDLALSVLDLSEDGICLLLQETLRAGEEVCLTLTSTAYTRPLKRLGSVAWLVPAADGAFCAGVRLHKRLSYADLSRLVRP
jgi:PilZ domain-containing protein